MNKAQIYLFVYLYNSTLLAPICGEGAGARSIRPLRFRPNAIPQSQAYEFVTSLEAKQLRVHCATVANHQAAHHFYLLSLTGGIPLKRDMVGQLLNRLSVVPLFL